MLQKNMPCCAGSKLDVQSVLSLLSELPAEIHDDLYSRIHALEDKEGVQTCFAANKDRVKTAKYKFSGV